MRLHVMRLRVMRFRAPPVAAPSAPAREAVAADVVTAPLPGLGSREWDIGHPTAESQRAGIDHLVRIAMEQAAAGLCPAPEAPGAGPAERLAAAPLAWVWPAMTGTGRRAHSGTV
jgi:hypothetical protein